MSELSELFARDPLKMTDQDITDIVKRQRESQAQYELGVKQAGAASKAPKPKSDKTLALLKDLGLEDT